MNKTEARKILRRTRDIGSQGLADEGSRFVAGPFSEAIRSLGDLNCLERDRYIVSFAYSDVGDVYDYLDAPRAAARAYRSAVKVNPYDTWAWSELGHMLNNMGQRAAGLKALREAQRLGCDSTLLQTYLEEALDLPFDWVSLHRAPIWEVNECLARNQPLAALRLLRGKRRLYLRKLRARAYGAHGDFERMLQEWEGFAAAEGEVAVELADWFYLRDEAWDEPRFWLALYALRDRLGYGWSFAHDWLWDGLHRAKGVGHLRHVRRENALWFRYEIARTERSYAKAARLTVRYPEWPEAKALAAELHRG